MMYEVEVRPGPNTEFFQYYTEVVEAPTSHDAVSRVQRANPGCIVRTTRSWSEYDDEDNSSSGGEIDGAGVLVLVAIGFLIYFWQYFLIIGGAAFVIWILFKIYQSNNNDY
jgi:preprotein translocase subunit Sss1